MDSDGAEHCFAVADDVLSTNRCSPVDVKVALG